MENANALDVVLAKLDSVTMDVRGAVEINTARTDELGRMFARLLDASGLSDEAILDIVESDWELDK
jgi:hypothetical protein